ncbi:MAG TPA: peptidylprolyl isomerase [candidate division Zixibacteria bacterium]|nr:peptidylprolyl isomerase [candidate division Zixibacteria bacterium]
MAKKTSIERKRRMAQQRKAEDEQKSKKRSRILEIAVVALVVIVGAAVAYVLISDSGEEEDPCDRSEPRALTDVAPADRNNYYSAYPEFTLDTTRDYEACIRTEKGDIHLRLFAEQAPITVNSFVFLANEGFYDGTTFHRVLADFMAQAGDPTGTGTGGPGYAFEDEVSSGFVFDRAGLLAMANTGQPVTNGSQFFITFNETPWLNGRHTIFGEVTEGQDVVDALTLIQPDPTGSTPPAGDVIEHINIIVR